MTPARCMSTAHRCPMAKAATAQRRTQLLARNYCGHQLQKQVPARQRIQCVRALDIDDESPGGVDPSDRARFEDDRPSLGTPPSFAGPGRGSSRYQSGGGRGRGNMETGGRSDGLVINQYIRAHDVRVQSAEKTPMGVMTMADALSMAEEQGVDVVMISPDAKPPLVRLVEVSKYKFELDKVRKESQRKTRASKVELKELKVRPSTGEHDYQVRLRSAIKFLIKGDKVKLTCAFKGREMDYPELGRKVLDRFITDLEAEKTVPPIAVESRPRLQGYRMSTVIARKSDPLAK